MNSRITLVCAVALSSFLVAGQGLCSDLFANPKNLKVLPSDISSEDLRTTMKGFSAALNARCSLCHEVDDALKMPDLDFASDTKRTKQIAREMMQLVVDINTSISGMKRDAGQQRVEVTCVTCHRGQIRPTLILSELDQAREQGGVDAVIARYSELREQYYGNHTFDLRPSTLAGYALKIAAGGDLEGGLEVLTYANENFPDEETVLFALARAHRQAGNEDQAIVFLRRLIELVPDSAFYAKQLQIAEDENAE